VSDAALNMGDLILNYWACGAECREDWLRMLACDNAGRYCEAEDFGRLIEFCEGGGVRLQ